MQNRVPVVFVWAVDARPGPKQLGYQKVDKWSLKNAIYSSQLIDGTSDRKQITSMF